MPAVIEATLAIRGERTRLEPARSLGPFGIVQRKAWSRLVWTGGTCNIGDHVTMWGDRYAAVLSDGVAIVDAAAGRHARLEFELADATGLAAHDGVLSISLPTAILSLPLAVLERLDELAGPVEIVADVSYPLRREDAREPAVVAWLYDNHDALVNVKQRQIWLDGRTYGLSRAMRFTMCDELWPGEFTAIEVPGQPRRELRAVETERRIPGRVMLGLPPHPLRHVIQPDGFRMARVQPLLERLADEPDDDPTRGVLIDVLQEEGVPFARQLAEARASTRVSSYALAPIMGPLRHLFTGVQWRAGLPWQAFLLSPIPDDEELLALIGTDVRLGMLRDIRRFNASIEAYVRVLRMPLAIGVRIVDSCGPEVLEALIDLGRDRLVRLHDVAITKRTVQALLADPTFDRVHELEVKVAQKNLDNTLAAITADDRGCFARTPRRVSLVADGNTLVIDRILARWPTLPLAAISASGITLERVGSGTRAHLVDPRPEALQALQRHLPEVPIEPFQPP